MHTYTLTNRITGQVYVGATTLSKNRRMDGHRQAAIKGRTTLIAQAIRQYGFDNFDYAVLETASNQIELLEMEAAAIQRLNTLTPNGYNRSSFGSHRWRFNDSERAKCSEAAKRALASGSRKPWNTGISTGPLSKATKRKLSRALKGHKAWNKGIPHTKETRLRLREAHAAMERHYNERAVEVDGTIYPSLIVARTTLGLSKMQLRYRLTLGRNARYVDAATGKKGT
jgi:group I intron endonuclease